MKDFKKLQDMDRRARELAGLYAMEKARADKLEAELRAIRENLAGDVVVAESETTTATCKDSLQVVNAAAIRSALEAVVKVGYPHNFQREAPHIRGYCYEITTAIEKCFGALSAPARNCDLYRTKKERDAAYKKYREYVILSSANPYVAQDEMMSKEDWLLAEAKGEAK